MNLMPRISGLLGGAHEHRGVTAVLDIGTSKIVALIARSDGVGDPVIRGIGQYASHGVKHGEVVDIDALSEAVGKTVMAAERMAGFEIDSVSVGISGSAQRAEIRKHRINVATGEITERDIRRLHKLDADQLVAEGRSVLHRLPLRYMLDHINGIRNPAGMFGDKLSVTMCLITAASAALRNIRTVVERNHLKVDRFIANGYAAGLSSLLEDERDLGSTLIEIGGGTTTIAYFADGQLNYLDTIPLGGRHITNDIARGLSIPIEEAERIKTLKGSVLAATGDSDETLTLPVIGHDQHAPPTIELGVLGEIIRARVEEILEHLIVRLEKTGLAAAAGQRVMLVGGAAQLPGMREFTATMIGRSVRIGRPAGVIGLAEATAGPAFASTVGLLRHCYAKQALEPTLPDTGRQNGTNRLGRLGDWFKYYIWDTGNR